MSSGFIAANDYSEHYIIGAFRRLSLKEIEELSVEVLQLGRRWASRNGQIGLDGTKINATPAGRARPPMSMRQDRGGTQGRGR